MKESDKHIENLIDKMMAENTLESPSIDFTSNIMSQILVVEKSKSIAYKPLIPKSTWISIGVVFSLLFLYCMYPNNNISNLEITKIYSDKTFALFSRIHFSENISYAVLIVLLMILVQIGVLKNYFNKKYEL